MGGLSMTSKQSDIMGSFEKINPIVGARPIILPPPPLKLLALKFYAPPFHRPFAVNNDHSRTQMRNFGEEKIDCTGSLGC